MDILILTKTAKIVATRHIFGRKIYAFATAVAPVPSRGAYIAPQTL